MPRATEPPAGVPAAAPAPSRSRPLPSLKGRALRLLAGREHSLAELQRKLQPFEETPGQLAAVLAELQAKGFIHEARVVDSVLHRRAPRLGTARVLQELREKGLGGELVASARAQLQQTERSRAQAVWQRKFGAVATDAAGRARQMRFLASRGFSAEAIRAVVAGADALAADLGDPD